MELTGTRYHKARRDLAAYPYALLKHPKPKNKLGRQMFTKLKVYNNEDHPHQAQKPVLIEI